MPLCLPDFCSFPCLVPFLVTFILSVVLSEIFTGFHLLLTFSPVFHHSLGAVYPFKVKIQREIDLSGIALSKHDCQSVNK